MSLKEYSVIMVTRNRPVSLEQCLSRTRTVLPPWISIIVFDDASTEKERVRAIIKSHANTVYLRSETLVGPGEGRNRCLRTAKTLFCLSIDDDCYLSEIPDLCRWLEDRPEDSNIAVVGFRYRNLPIGDLAPTSEVEGVTNSFHGGASLLRREMVLTIGGYLDWLVFAGEDTELAMRVTRLGYYVWYDPKVIVQHARSNEGRDRSLASFYYVRNTFILNLLHHGDVIGFALGLLRALRRGLFNTDNPVKTWAGIWAAIVLWPKCIRARRELFNQGRMLSR